ncbi:MAG TPA: inositol monophosphatase, partial [Stellaceae bacterium]|nr:inositol monophosphatase [Stellaceae bacterium]
ASFIRETARSVILPRFRALKREEISEKSPGDFVTVADIEAERRLSALLTQAQPGSEVLGEEGAAKDPDLLRLAGSAPSLWIIDPIDGTNNFARGLPGFAVILAYVERGAVRAGWLYDPLGDRMVWAVSGQGAWSNRTRLKTASHPEKISGAAYGIASSGERAVKALGRSPRVGGIRNQNCSGLEYLDIAAGETHFSLHSHSLPWDHAAGMLITAEAGGKAGFLDGGPYDPGVFDRALLAASGGDTWQIVHEIVTSPAKHRPA